MAAFLCNQVTAQTIRGLLTCLIITHLCTKKRQKTLFSNNLRGGTWGLNAKIPKLGGIELSVFSA